MVLEPRTPRAAQVETIMAGMQQAAETHNLVAGVGEVITAEADAAGLNLVSKASVGLCKKL